MHGAVPPHSALHVCECPSSILDSAGGVNERIESVKGGSTRRKRYGGRVRVEFAVTDY